MRFAAMRVIALCALAAVGIEAVPALAAPGSCAALRSATVASVEVTAATEALGSVVVGAGRGTQEYALPVPVCRVRGIVRAAQGSQVRFELWIPLGEAWNGKYLQLGNGGFAGRIPYHDFAMPIRRGYAVAASDGGHEGSDFTDARWARGSPTAIEDFAYRAAGSTRDAAVALLRTYAGRAPVHSYFLGCSNGGREALQMTQRFPQAFDGVVAGNPALYWTSLLAFQGRIARDLARSGATLSPAKLQLLQRSSQATCNADATGVISNPGACRFDPGVLACEAQRGPSNECLTPAELGIARAVYAGFTELGTGTTLAGPNPGAEAAPGSWDGWLLGGQSPGEESAGHAFSKNFYAYFVRGDPAFDIRSLNDADVAAGFRRFGTLLDAADADLRQFAARGGKLIQYHGWNDPGIPASVSIDYHARVQQRVPGASAFHRFYLVPGMLHCGGGPGPSDIDWLGALELWVERGEVPQDLVARRSDAASGGEAGLVHPYLGVGGASDSP